MIQFPPIDTETPRYEIETQIRGHLRRHAPPACHTPTEGELATLCAMLSARDRAIVYRVALSLIDHSIGEQQ